MVRQGLLFDSYQRHWGDEYAVISTCARTDKAFFTLRVRVTLTLTGFGGIQTPGNEIPRANLILHIQG